MTAWAALGARLLRLLPPEAAHRCAIAALRHGLAPRAGDDPASLATTVWGLKFPNPVGMAAGFDKDAEVAGPLLDQGFGFVEVGTVTPRPQPGNPRPRLFRLNEDAALINRLGFNNAGMDAAARRLAARPRGIVGINIGRNRDSADAVADYVAGLERLGPFADYCVVNVSSPNTPGLRDLQAQAALDKVVSALLEARATLGRAGVPPLLVKIAPDLDDAAAEAIAGVVLARGVDGLIVSNTTVARPALRSRHRDEAGGLSGRPLMAPSTDLLRRIYRLTDGRIPLIGVGGIAGADDAYAKIRAGASLIQLYTALIYQGPGLVARIKQGLAARLDADGFAHVADAVGIDAGKSSALR